MNRITASLLRAVLGVSMMFVMFAAPANAAGKVPATVRVVTSGGKILVDKKLRTGTTTVRTSRRAECFGPGSTDGRVEITGPTALGILGQASTFVKSLRPLLLTTSDFGLGVCGIGGFVAPATGFWLLKVNHADSITGGESTRVKKNDVVLWYLIQDFTQPSPEELFLKAPDKVRRGKSFRVRVFAYDSNGKRNPFEGAKLSGLSGVRTNEMGYARVTLKRKTRLVARRSGTIASNRATIRIKK